MKISLLRTVQMVALVVVCGGLRVALSDRLAENAPLARQIRDAKDADAVKRAKAVGNLVGANSTLPGVLETLENALSDADANVRAEAARALAYVVHRGGTADERRRATVLLAQRINDSDASAREQAGFGLVLLGDQSDQALELAAEASRHGTPLDRNSVLTTLTRCPAAEEVALRALEEAAGDREPVMRAYAIQVLLAWQSRAETAVSSHVVQIFIRALDDPDPRVQSAGASALGTLGPQAGPGLAALIACLPADRSPASRLSAIEALGCLGKTAAEALPALRELAEHDPRPCVRDAARRVCVLIEFGPQHPADDPLSELLSNLPDPDEYDNPAGPKPSPGRDMPHLPRRHDRVAHTAAR